MLNYSSPTSTHILRILLSLKYHHMKEWMIQKQRIFESFWTKRWLHVIDYQTKLGEYSGNHLLLACSRGVCHLREENLKFQLENQIDCFIPFGKLQWTWLVICSVDCKQSLFFFRFSKGSVSAHKRWASREKQGRQPEKTLTLCTA